MQCISDQNETFNYCSDNIRIWSLKTHHIHQYFIAKTIHKYNSIKIHQYLYLIKTNSNLQTMSTVVFSIFQSHLFPFASNKSIRIFNIEESNLKLFYNIAPLHSAPQNHILVTMLLSFV